jgi:cobalt-zinc-cadmium resistance protein CzcA
MVPAMVARGIGSDIQRPLATVVVGGLASTLILTPLALPAVLWLGERLGLRARMSQLYEPVKEDRRQ